MAKKQSKAEEPKVEYATKDEFIKLQKELDEKLERICRHLGIIYK